MLNADIATEARIRRSKQSALENDILTLAGHINAAEYRFVKLIDAFDECNGWHGQGIKSFAHWLNYRIGLSEVVAREKVRVAKALRDLPLIDAAFATGEISYSKVRAMTRVATPRNEANLLDVAHYGTASHIERLARAYRKCQRITGEVSASSDARCSWFQDDDGMVEFRIRLPAEEGAVLVKAIERLVEQINNDERLARAKTTGVDVPAETKAPVDVSVEVIEAEADAHMECAGAACCDEACTSDGPDDVVDSDVPRGFPDAHGTPTDLENVPAETSGAPGDSGASGLTDRGPTERGPTERGPTDRGPTERGPTDRGPTERGPTERGPTIPWPMKRAMAVARMAESWLNSERVSDAGGHPGDRCEILVHLNANQADVDRQIVGDDFAVAGEHLFLSAETAQRLACDAVVRPIVENDEGNVVGIGRRSRSIPERMRLALALRDGGCRFPGCTETRWVEGHHIHHWAHGGETSLDNLVTLCRIHHRALHQGAYAVESEPGTGGVRFMDCRFMDSRSTDSRSADSRGKEMPRSLYPQFTPRDDGSPRGEEVLAEEHDTLGLGITNRTADSRWDGGSMDVNTVIAHLYRADAARD